MTALKNAYDFLVGALAWLSGLLLVLVFAAICVDVVLRNLGLQSSAHLFTFTEYALLMIPCFGGPWLVRERGHVFVEIGLNLLSPANRRRAVVLVGLACIVVCLIMAWYGAEVVIKDYLNNEKDVRSMDAPRWLLVLCIPVSFLFMALEFARFLLRGDDFLGSMMIGAAAPEQSASQNRPG